MQQVQHCTADSVEAMESMDFLVQTGKAVWVNHSSVSL
jgi:hypothetical protein